MSPNKLVSNVSLSTGAALGSNGSVQGALLQQVLKMFAQFREQQQAALQREHQFIESRVAAMLEQQNTMGQRLSDCEARLRRGLAELGGVKTGLADSLHECVRHVEDMDRRQTDWKRQVDKELARWGSESPEVQRLQELVKSHTERVRTLEERLSTGVPRGRERPSHSAGHGEERILGTSSPDGVALVSPARVEALEQGVAGLKTDLARCFAELHAATPSDPLPDAPAASARLEAMETEMGSVKKLIGGLQEWASASHSAHEHRHLGVKSDIQTCRDKLDLLSTGYRAGDQPKPLDDELRACLSVLRTDLQEVASACSETRKHLEEERQNSSSISDQVAKLCSKMQACEAVTREVGPAVDGLKVNIAAFKEAFGAARDAGALSRLSPGGPAGAAPHAKDVRQLRSRMQACEEALQAAGTLERATNSALEPRVAACEAALSAVQPALLDVGGGVTRAREALHSIARLDGEAHGAYKDVVATVQRLEETVAGLATGFVRVDQLDAAVNARCERARIEELLSEEEADKEFENHTRQQLFDKVDSLNARFDNLVSSLPHTHPHVEHGQDT